MATDVADLCDAAAAFTVAGAAVETDAEVFAVGGEAALRRGLDVETVRAGLSPADKRQRSVDTARIAAERAQPVQVQPASAVVSAADSGVVQSAG